MNKKHVLYMVVGLIIGIDVSAWMSIVDDVERLKTENAKLIEQKKKAEQKWIDFNRSFVPETALPRLIINKGK